MAIFNSYATVYQRVFGSKTRYHCSSTVVSNATQRGQRGPRYRIDEVLPWRYQHHSLDCVWLYHY